jgi:4-amino-4-deoxy-L-arabinose transferase-like glycosyltransferase
VGTHSHRRVADELSFAERSKHPTCRFEWRFWTSLIYHDWVETLANPLRCPSHGYAQRPLLKRLKSGRKLRATLFSPTVSWAIGLTLIAIAVRAPSIGMAISVIDTGSYLLRAEELLDGEGFRDAIRTPGLPLLFAGLKTLGAEPIVTLVVFQNLLGILTPAAVLLVGTRYFNRPAAIVAGFLAAASPLLFYSEQYALSDYLFGIAIFIGAVLLVEAVIRVRVDRSSWRWLFAAGATFGIATMIRGNGQYAVVAAPIALLLTVQDWRRVLRSSAVALGAMAVVLTPWVAHNLLRFGTPQVTTFGGEALYLRIIDHDRVLPPGDTREARLARHIYRNMYAFAPEEEERNSGLVLANTLEVQGVSNTRVSSVMTDIALDAVWQNKSLYFTNTWDIFREYRSMYDPYEDPVHDQIGLVEFDLANPPPGATLEGREVRPGDSYLTKVPWELAQGLNRLVYLFSLAGLLALALPFVGPSRSRVAATVLLTFVLLGWLVGAASLHFEARYGLPFAFMGWLLMSTAAIAGARLVLGGALKVCRKVLSSSVVHELRYTDGSPGARS